MNYCKFRYLREGKMMVKDWKIPYAHEKNKMIQAPCWVKECIRCHRIVYVKKLSKADTMPYNLYYDGSTCKCE